MLDYLVTLVSRLGHWGYLIIFLGATLECAAFLGVLVPGEALVVFGGFLADVESLEVGDLIVWVGVGAILGDSLGYELGRRLGRPWLLRYGRFRAAGLFSRGQLTAGGTLARRHQCDPGRRAGAAHRAGLAGALAGAP